MPVETRYFRKYDDLLITQGTVTYELGYGSGYLNLGYWGIRVWIRHSDLSVTDISGWPPVAIVTKGTTGEAILSNTWDCPETALASDDKIGVAIYLKIEDVLGWYLLWSRCDTEALNAEKLDAATWTVYYYVDIFWHAGAGMWIYYIRGNSATYNTRIENFTWTPLPPPPVVPVPLINKPLVNRELINQAIIRVCSPNFRK
ncbi:hypothetical protein ES702_07619 [subsurface metagenome]